MKFWFAYRNTNLVALKTLFDITQRLILSHAFEILNIFTIEWIFGPWMRSTLCHDQAIKWATAKVHVCTASVSCLGKMHEHTEANAKWTSQLQDVQRVLRITWHLKKIQEKLEAQKTNPEQFGGRIVFMSMFNDIDWTKKQNSTECFFSNS